MPGRTLYPQHLAARHHTLTGRQQMFNFGASGGDDEVIGTTLFDEGQESLSVRRMVDDPTGDGSRNHRWCEVEVG